MLPRVRYPFISHPSPTACLASQHLTTAEDILQPTTAVFRTDLPLLIYFARFRNSHRFLPAMPSKRSTNVAFADDEDKARTLSDWRSLKLAALKLKCNQYSLSEQGNKDEVIHRLMEKMEELLREAQNNQNNLQNNQNNLSDGDTTDDPEQRDDNETDETVHYGDDFLDLEAGTMHEFDERRTDNSRHDVATNENGEQHPAAILNNDGDGESRTNIGDFQPDHQQHHDAQQFQQYQQNSFQNQNDDAASAVQLILQELRSIQSDVRSLSSKHDTLDKKVKQSLSKPSPPSSSPPRQPDARKRKSTHRDQDKHDQPSKKRSKQTSTHQRSHHSDSLTVTFANNTNTQSLAPNTNTQSLSLNTNNTQTAVSGGPLAPSATNAGSTDSYQQQQTTNDQISTNPQNQVQYQFQPPGAYAPYPATTGMSSIQPYSYDPWNAFQNPFVPPSIKETVLKKIENRQFVDFIDLLPENQICSIDGACTADDPSFVVEQSSGCLKQKTDSAKVTRVKVSTFHRWCTAWCIYSQAYLSFHPEEYHKLFMYHSNFVGLVHRYKYEACYNYDAAFRLSMANQKDSATKTCFWETVNTEIRDRFCSDNTLSKCTYCKASGHYESSCTLKQKHKSETLPAQLAAALTSVQLTQQQAPTPTTQHTSQTQPWNNNNNNNRNNNNNNNSYNRSNNNGNNNGFRPPKNNRSNSTPASQKFCWRFDKNIFCAKPPCQFRHACQTCGDTTHGYYSCYQTTSTNFIPTSGP